MREKLFPLLVRSQVRRLEEEYKDYFFQPHTEPLVDFFFRKIYTHEGKEKRDEEAYRLYARWKHILSERAQKRVESLFELNQMTDTLDNMSVEYILSKKRLREKYLKKGEIPIEDLPKIYREANPLDLRERHLALLLKNMEGFISLLRHSVIRVFLKPLKLMAKLSGTPFLYETFEEGYQAIQGVSQEELFLFLEEVRKREKKYWSKVYGCDFYIPSGGEEKIK